MFEKIVLRRSDNGPAFTPTYISAGDIAEALIYYQNLHLILDAETLNNLIKQISAQGLLNLLRRPNVSAVYCSDTLATQTENNGQTEVYGFASLTITGSENGTLFRNKKERLEHSLIQSGLAKKEIAHFVDRFRQLVPERRLIDPYFCPEGLTHAVLSDLEDPKFASEAVRRILSNTQGTTNLLGGFNFEIHSEGEFFRVLTDLNLDTINKARSKLQPAQHPIRIAGLLTDILEARADLSLAAHYGGEFQTGSASSAVIRLRHSEILRRAGISSDERQQFKDIVLPECRSIKESIDCKERSFTDFLKLLEKSDKFRAWIQKVGPDEKLVSAYLRDVTAEGWLEKLPIKTARYVLSLAMGAVDPTVGAAAGAADTYLLGKVFGGWKPSHFVNKKLKPFLSERNGLV